MCILNIAGGGKKSQRIPAFKISSVSVNAQSILRAEQELEPLAAAIQQAKDEQRRSVLRSHFKFYM